jgi:hypothetical protein
VVYLLLIAIVLAAASALYVAASFNKRAAPMVRAVNSISGQVEMTNKNLQGRLDAIQRQIERIGAQEGSSVKADSLVAAMLNAEAYVARQNWGQPPQLFSLATKSSLTAADRVLSGELRDEEPDTLIPVAQDPLPEGEPFDVLATVRWPDQVVGCVLVTELVTLPPEAEKDAPGDPVAAERWASARPDKREARLAVCVSRDGDYICGLRIRDEDDIQVGPDLADDIVAALLGTF